MSIYSHFIGIDVGTGSVRACIVNFAGDIVGLASKDIGLWQPQQGYYEQSTRDIWRCICHSVKQALSEGKVNPSSVRGISFDATCSLTAFANDTDEPVSVTAPNFDTDRNVILWLDHRPVQETETVNATNHKLLNYVGGRMSIEMEIPKVLWLKNHMPPHLYENCKFFDLVDALTHLATGGNERSYCSAVCKQGYVPVGVDGSVSGWQPDFLKAVGLEDIVADEYRKLGGVSGENGRYLSAGERVGPLSEHAAAELGLPAGVAVGSGVIDAYAGWIGTVGTKVDLTEKELVPGVTKDDQSQAYTRLAAVAGTSTCHLALTEGPIFVPGVWGPYRDTVIAGSWMSEGGQSATGELLKHVVTTHPAYQEAKSAADASSQNIFSFLNEKLQEMTEAESAPSISYIARNLFFYGDLFGNRSPIADAQMAGSIIGVTNDVTINALALLYYGTLEFIALQTKQIVVAMNDAGYKINSIFMSGSQCQNDVLMKLIATACRMPVVIPLYIHAAVCHGAAMLGARAASTDVNGQTEDLWKIMDRMSKPGATVFPSREKYEHALLHVKYTVFLEQCLKQAEYRSNVDSAVRGWKKTKQ